MNDMTTIESILTRLTKAVSGTDKELYTEEELNAMFELKRLFDPQLRLNPGNIFGRF